MLINPVNKYLLIFQYVQDPVLNIEYTLIKTLDIFLDLENLRPIQGNRYKRNLKKYVITNCENPIKEENKVIRW